MLNILLRRKQCTQCKELKSFDEFYKDKRNNDGLRAYCKQCASKFSRQWEAKNPEKGYWGNLKKSREQQIVKWQNRQARIKHNGGVVTLQEWRSLKVKYNYTCLCCKRSEPEIKLTLDHVIPLALGGLNVIENAQPLCLSCNCKKNDRHIDYR